MPMAFFKMSRSICARSSSFCRRRISACSADGAAVRRRRHARAAASAVPFATPPGTQHRGLNAQLRRHLRQRPPAARQQRHRLPLELVRERSSCRRHQGTSLPQELIRGVHPTGGRSSARSSRSRTSSSSVRSGRRRRPSSPLAPAPCCSQSNGVRDVAGAVAAVARLPELSRAAGSRSASRPACRDGWAWPWRVARAAVSGSARGLHRWLECGL